MPPGPPPTATTLLIAADAPPAGATTPSPLLRPFDTLFHDGPRALADAAGAFAGDLAINVLWLISVSLVAVAVRLLAKRAIASLTARLADPHRDGRIRQLLHRLRARGNGRGAASMPSLTASLTTLIERRRQRARAIGSLASSLMSGLLVVGVVLLILFRAGVPAGTLASVGVLGLVGAVLTQGLAKDILAGAFVLMEDTYGVGDYIDVTFGAEGVVEQIGLRTTRLRGPDGTIWHVRHSEMVRIANRTQEQTLLQIDVTVGFPELDTPPTTAQDTPAAARAAGVGELARAERLIRASLDRLDRDLYAARHIGDADADGGALPSTLAAVMPELVASDVAATTWTKLAKVDDHALIDTAPIEGLPEMLERMLEDVDVPVLAETVVVGLTGADATSVTLRVRARVADVDRDTAAAVLRRRLFVDVTSDGLSVSFAAVDPAAR